jgi:hypothetical protein
MQLQVLQRSPVRAMQVHSLINLKDLTSGERRVVVGRVLDLSGSVSDSWPISRRSKDGPVHLQDLR